MKIAITIDKKIFLIDHIERMIKEYDNGCERVENGLALRGALTCITNTPTVERMKNNTDFVIVRDT